MGSFILGLMMGVLGGGAIAFGFARKKLAEAEREKQSALRHQRQVLESDRELRLQALAKTLQADCALKLQAQEFAWKAKNSALEVRDRHAELTELEPEPINDFQQYESLLDLLDDDDETED